MTNQMLKAFSFGKKRLNNRQQLTKQSRLRWLHTLMFVINFVMIGFLSVTIYVTTNKICSDYEARSFLESAKYLPMIPWQVPTYTMLFLTLLGVSTSFKQTLFQKNRSKSLLLLFLVDIMLCSFITYYINFSYKGLFLIVIASIFLYVPLIRMKVVLLVLTLLVFIVLDYDLLTVRINVVSLQDYLNYYDQGTRFYLYSIKNVMDSLNQIGFILFFSLLIQGKISENKEYIKLNNTLEEKVDELKVANEKLEIFTQESISMAKIKERNRLAREIHDILGHSLTNIAMGVDASIDLMDIDIGFARRQMLKIRDVARKGLVDVRRSVRELKIDTIEQYALMPAIEKLIEELNAFSNAEIVLSIEGQVLKMQDDEEQTIYRVIQESLTNAIRHGHASHVDVSLQFQYYGLRLAVRDNGVGCDLITKGFGLAHIEERIEMLGGKVAFQSETDHGFQTEVNMPIRWGNAYD